MSNSNEATIKNVRDNVSLEHSPFCNFISFYVLKIHVIELEKILLFPIYLQYPEFYSNYKNKFTREISSHVSYVFQGYAIHVFFSKTEQDIVKI